MSMIPRVATGIRGFDELVENGFPSESVILLAGNPGAGKTTFAAQFVYEGATKLGDRGIYVCFAETKRAFLRSMMNIGWDFERLEMEGRVAVLDLSTTKEPGIQSNLDIVLEKITTMRARRLVIDSFTAMSMAMKEPIDIRYLLHLLYKFLQRIGCTTIMISDTPWGSLKIGSGVEEFIADGIILMQTHFDEEGNLRRRLRILKLRSTNHSKRTHDYNITNEGVIIFPEYGEGGPRLPAEQRILMPDLEPKP
ncbi:MAG: RAD55 family ATPase [Candidatus Bathyarchaeia archaeon]